jgi:fructose/tagatose bisphosphate aldolase
MSDRLQKLIDASRNRSMSEAEKEAQRRSFAFGNANIENSRVTRAMVDDAAEKSVKSH